MISFQPMTTPPMTQLHSLILRFLLLPALAVALPLSLHACASSAALASNPALISFRMTRLSIYCLLT